MTYGRGNPEVERVIAEMNAVNAILSSSTPTRDAQQMVRAIEAQWPTPHTVPEFVLRAAMARITGSAAPVGEPERTSEPVWSTRAFELIALAWLAWSQGDPSRAHFFIARWSTEGSEKTHLDDKGAIQAFAVALWACAVEALVEGRREDSLRFFKRVYEVGSNFGTESHPTVLWTMAASFFTPEG